MTKAQLIQVLQKSKLPGDTPIILSIDSEGNEYNELRRVLCSDVWSPIEQQVYLEGPITPELSRQGFSEEDLYDGDDAKRCISLWP